MVWLQHGGADKGSADDLIDAGTPRDPVVLPFRPPEKRKPTFFATG